MCCTISTSSNLWTFLRDYFTCDCQAALGLNGFTLRTEHFRSLQLLGNNFSFKEQKAHDGIVNGEGFRSSRFFRGTLRLHPRAAGLRQRLRRCTTWRGPWEPSPEAPSALAFGDLRNEATGASRSVTESEEEEGHRLLSLRRNLRKKPEANRSDRTQRTKGGGGGRNTDSRCKTSQSREEKKRERMKQEVPFSIKACSTPARLPGAFLTREPLDSDSRFSDQVFVCLLVCFHFLRDLVARWGHILACVGPKAPTPGPCPPNPVLRPRTGRRKFLRDESTEGLCVADSCVNLTARKGETDVMPRPSSLCSRGKRSTTTPDQSPAAWLHCRELRFSWNSSLQLVGTAAGGASDLLCEGHGTQCPRHRPRQPENPQLRQVLSGEVAWPLVGALPISCLLVCPHPLRVSPPLTPQPGQPRLCLLPFQRAVI